MILEYTYHNTPYINKILRELDILRRVIDLLPHPPHLDENLRRQSFLQSSIYSARIEGNKLKPGDLTYSGSELKTKNRQKLEIYNILRAINWIYSSQSPKKLSYSLITKLHKLVLANISGEAGSLRTEQSAVFNQAGIAVFIAPPAADIDKLIRKMIRKINSSKDSGPVKAALCHFNFEKIHPFMDGNGRVGRLLSSFILKNSGFGMRGLVLLEKFLDENRQTYYDLLAINKKDITEFIEFILKGILFQTQNLIGRLKDVKEEKPRIYLLPRRREIVELIEDHKIVSFDFIRRRFMAVGASTLHYDLAQLIKNKLIIKMGSTRGVCYSIYIT